MYKVKTFARHDDGEHVTYELVTTSDKFYSKQDALTSSTLLATIDAATLSLITCADGFMITVCYNDNPFAAIEHDGIRITTWWYEELEDYEPITDIEFWEE